MCVEGAIQKKNRYIQLINQIQSEVTKLGVAVALLQQAVSLKSSGCSSARLQCPARADGELRRHSWRVPCLSTRWGYRRATPRWWVSVPAGPAWPGFPWGVWSLDSAAGLSGSTSWRQCSRPAQVEQQSVQLRSPTRLCHNSGSELYLNTVSVLL